jgi:hypothetical protein
LSLALQAIKVILAKRVISMRRRISGGETLRALPFGRLCCGEPNAISNAIGYAKHRSRSHDALIRVYDAAVNVIETHEHKSDFK